jgi:hypothetical protein
MSKQVTTTLDFVPETRLELRWENQGSPNKWKCYYELIMEGKGVGYDIRVNEGEKDIIRISMGGCDRDGSAPDKWYADNKKLDTPFRDGCHILSDMKILHLRGFVRCGDKINEVVAAIHPNFEEATK